LVKRGKKGGRKEVKRVKRRGVEKKGRVEGSEVRGKKV
jgi:hypothetical protein